MKNFSWLRQMEVSLSSTLSGKKLIFGVADDYLGIDIQVYKYMGVLKDNAVIKIMNLTYGEIVRIIQEQYYIVEVKCGYKQGKGAGQRTIFKGQVIHISNDLNDNKTSIVYLLCASDLVARFSQRRINLSLNSGINLYSAVRFICKYSGIPETNVDKGLKQRFLTEILSVNDTPANWVQKVIDSTPSLIGNSDSTANAILGLYDSPSTNRSMIILDDNEINLSGGFPRLTSEGLKLTIMPTRNFICGDIIKIDNSIINISASSTQEANSNYGYYLDQDGCYVIYEAVYSLQNRGTNFMVELNCKSYNLLKQAGLIADTTTSTTTSENRYKTFTNPLQSFNLQNIPMVQ